MIGGSSTVKIPNNILWIHEHIFRLTSRRTKAQRLQSFCHIAGVISRCQLTNRPALVSQSTQDAIGVQEVDVRNAPSRSHSSLSGREEVKMQQPEQGRENASAWQTSGQSPPGTIIAPVRCRETDAEPTTGRPGSEVALREAIRSNLIHRPHQLGMRAGVKSTVRIDGCNICVPALGSFLSHEVHQV